MIAFERLEITLDDLPEVARAACAPDSPAERRLLLARASIPMAPAELVATVSFLLSDQSDLVASAAKETFASLPPALFLQALQQMTSAPVLDVVARTIKLDNDDAVEIIVKNKFSSDNTIGFIASRAVGNVVEIIARNQMRVQRCPRIVEAIYFNPNARMGLVLNLLEDAVRLGLDMSSIPGYDEIVASIKGGKAKAEPAPAAEPEAAGPAAEEESEQPAQTFQAEEGGEIPKDWLTGLDEEDGDAAGLDDDSFSAILNGNIGEGGEDPEGGPLGKNLLAEIPRMSVPQKVRLALLGNEGARRALIRDTKRVVYMSVIKSPRLTDKEVADFAKNKALNEEVIRTIATNREWTRNYAVKMALIENPKCPSAIATGFLRMMQQKDVKTVARSHDVPGYVARAAKQILDAIEAGKKF